ncbi:MAG: hypothetical protein QXF86_03210 [Candidatus Bilamarchaeaceae archaeon]
MKKMIIAISIILLVLSGTLFFIGYKTKGFINTPLGSLYLIKNKLFQETTDIRTFITPHEYSIYMQAQEFKDNQPIVSVVKAFNWLENGYHYAIDDLVILNNGIIIVRGGIDSWNLPVLTLAQKHQNGGECWVDCEDGTFLLVSLLRALDIDAWASIGTVEIQGNLYGHAWATVNLNGKEYLLETTIGEQIQELKLVSSLPFYKPYVQFNEKEIRTIIQADINKEIYPPLPPAKIPELKKILGGS